MGLGISRGASLAMYLLCATRQWALTITNSLGGDCDPTSAASKNTMNLQVLEIVSSFPSHSVENLPLLLWRGSHTGRASPLLIAKAIVGIADVQFIEQLYCGMVLLETDQPPPPVAEPPEGHKRRWCTYHSCDLQDEPEDSITKELTGQRVIDTTHHTIFRAESGTSVISG